jgi:hypothetical protein
MNDKAHREVHTDRIPKLVLAYLAGARSLACQQDSILSNFSSHVDDWICPRVGLLHAILLTYRLGDRHGENILFDGVTGDTVHVDLNCLFEKVCGLSARRDRLFLQTGEDF